jgi:hypothetical protein
MEPEPGRQDEQAASSLLRFHATLHHDRSISQILLELETL